MLRIIRTAEAEHDLLDIWQYVAADNDQAADRLLDSIHDKCLLLATSPLLGISCFELGRELRMALVGNYAIFYRPTKKEIVVVRVLHGAHDIEGLLGKEA